MVQGLRKQQLGAGAGTDADAGAGAVVAGAGVDNDHRGDGAGPGAGASRWHFLPWPSADLISQQPNKSMHRTRAQERIIGTLIAWVSGIYGAKTICFQATCSKRIRNTI